VSFNNRTSESLMDTLTVDMVERSAKALWQKCQRGNYG
jgi:hypothetical protein